MSGTFVIVGAGLAGGGGMEERNFVAFNRLGIRRPR
jgi:hypothetical protein